MVDFKRVDIKTGFKCNNNCLFCVQAHKKALGNRSTDQIMDDLKQAKLSGCGGVVFTGGECTIRKDMLELAKAAKDMGFERIQLQTNARMLSDLSLCRGLVEAGITEFAPALHGHEARLHDYLTQAPGSFRQTVKAIMNLRKLQQKVFMNTVVVKPNYRFLPDIARLFVKLDVDQFQFAFVHAVGNALENFDKMMPQASLAAPFMKKGMQIGLDNGKRVMAEAMPFCLMKGYEKHCSEFFIPPTEIRDADSYDPCYEDTRRQHGKVKFSKCRECRYDDVCEGPWKEYPERFGDGEFQPVK